MAQSHVTEWRGSYEGGKGKREARECDVYLRCARNEGRVFEGIWGVVSVIVLVMGRVVL